MLTLDHVDNVRIWLQDASPSPSEVLGSMYPPSTFLPYPSTDGGREGGAAATASTTSTTTKTSPSQSQASNFLPALPKFQQAFGKKSHFDNMILAAPSAVTSAPALPGINPLQDNCLQVTELLVLKIPSLNLFSLKKIFSCF